MTLFEGRCFVAQITDTYNNVRTTPPNYKEDAQKLVVEISRSSLPIPPAVALLGIAEQSQRIENALTYTTPVLHSGALHTLHTLRYIEGDDLVLWTEGDPQAQKAKIDKGQFDTALGDPDDPDAFTESISTDKVAELPGIAESLVRRGNESITITDNTPQQLYKAKAFIEEQQKGGLIPDIDVHYIWAPLLEGDETSEKLAQEEHPEFIKVNSQQELLEKIQELKEITAKKTAHLIDLDGVIVNLAATRQARMENVAETINGEEPPQPPEKLHPVQIDGEGERFLYDGPIVEKLTQTEQVKPDVTGRQAQVIRYTLPNEGGSKVVKGYAIDSPFRPNIPQWNEAGGFEGINNLIELTRNYYRKIKDLLPVPEYEIVLGKTKDGTFFMSGVAEYIEGPTDSQILRTANDEEKKALTETVLDASKALLAAPRIGADLKPENWVNGVNVDIFPPIMKDEHTGQIYTEWPPITKPELQGFLERTHLTPAALGYRVYQELCQTDPGSRTLYRETITEKLREWTQDPELGPEFSKYQEEIIASMQPETSVLLEAVLNRQVSSQQGFTDIRANIAAKLMDSSTHPIYDVREMFFALSEYALKNNQDMNELHKIASDILAKQIENGSLDTEWPGRINSAIEKVNDPHLNFLTFGRRLMHLSDKNIEQQETLTETALLILEAAVAQIQHPQS